MANLRANRITSTEVFETTGSVQFDGTNDNLSIADSADFTFGSGDFTMEAWIYPQQYGDFPSIINKYTTNSSSSQWFWGLEGSGGSGQGFYLYFGSSNYQIRNLGNVPLNQWTHCAVSRQGSSVRVFQNGILQGTLEVGSTSMNDTSVAVTIGTDGSNLYDFKGHISNARIIKGTALYTKNFTPPTRELEVIPNTVLLCAQSKTQANREATGKTITVNGNAVASELTPGLLTNVVKSGGSSAITGSVEFDGNSWLQTPDSNDFTFGSNSFTVEGWFNLSKDSTGERWILGQLNSNGNPANGTLGSIGIRKLAFNETGFESQLQGDLYSTTGQISVRSGTASTITSASDWTHFAFVRDGNSMKMYVNGIGGLATDVTGLTARDATGNFSIGRVGDYANNGWKGFLSNIRVIKGTALYTSNFIPPTRKLIRLPGTVLLCCQDSNDPTTEATGKTILLNGSGSTYSVGIGTTTPNPSKFTPYSSTDGTVVFDGITKINTPNYFYLPTGSTEQRGRGRGVYMGGGNPTALNTIDYINIQSTGNAFDFGDLITAVRNYGIVSNSNRCLCAGGITPVNTIEYITISTQSNSTDFGDLTQSRSAIGSASNSTRGVFSGGNTPTSVNTIDYVTIASTGNASDFGDASVVQSNQTGGLNSPTRGLFAGGINNIIEFITFASTGNALDFGDIPAVTELPGACSSSTRGIIGGGELQPSGTLTNTISYITLSTTGNTQDFGDLVTITRQVGGCSNSIRGIFAGGLAPTVVNTINYVTISSTGNAQDFGDLTQARQTYQGGSDSHGGLG